MSARCRRGSDPTLLMDPSVLGVVEVGALGGGGDVYVDGLEIRRGGGLAERDREVEFAAGQVDVDGGARVVRRGPLSVRQSDGQTEDAALGDHFVLGAE